MNIPDVPNCSNSSMFLISTLINNSEMNSLLNCMSLIKLGSIEENKKKKIKKILFPLPKLNYKANLKILLVSML